MESKSLLQKALSVLEWPRVLETLAGQARSVMGAGRCRALPLANDLPTAETRARETAEMLALQGSNEPFPSLSFPDLREPLSRVGKGAVLELHELRDVSLVLGLAFDVLRYLGRHREQAPALWAVAEPLEGLHAAYPVKLAIDRAVDPDGHLRESATPELRRLTHHAQALKQTMRHRLEAILSSRRYAETLQERYFAQREGRYVIPVKVEMRDKVPGIVHDVSASGATVFVEPRELVALNNAIKVADLEVEREVRRILQELSALVRAHAPALLVGLEGLAALDCIGAKAAFSQMVCGRAVSLNDRGRIALRQARHPLLLLARGQVVPNDIVLDESVRVLVISGPNTGGKTVTLKLIGLIALMVRAGLHPPCAEGSDMAVFPEIYADIGDAQDLTKDLSSFSAHMTQMIQLLRQASQEGSRREEAHALVLLDEPVTSTDPVEGAALAEALLVRLAELGLKVIVTTHYNGLKALAQTTPGFLNASVEFDVSRLAPTYRLIMGLPGGSSAIEIAGRLGLDEALLERAAALLRREDVMLEQMLGELQEKQRRLDQDLARAVALRAEAEQAARQAAEIAERLQRSEREERKQARRKLTEELLKARAEVQAVLDGLKRERTLVKAREAKARLGAIEERARTGLAPGRETVPLDTLRAGDAVEVAGLGVTGTLLEAPQGKKRVRVRVGDVEMSVTASSLIGLRDGQVVTPERPEAAPGESVSLVRVRGREAAPTVLDLRGKTAEEALDATLAALDKAAMDGAPLLRLIHGHGTGRLKGVLRDYLKTSPYVATFRPGERAEGGDGVTIVELQ
ncbi:endonuclease MutS2 [Nitrospira sp. Kam-Ns4a]